MTITFTVISSLCLHCIFTVCVIWHKEEENILTVHVYHRSNHCQWLLNPAPGEFVLKDLNVMKDLQVKKYHGTNLSHFIIDI